MDLTTTTAMESEVSWWFTKALGLLGDLASVLCDPISALTLFGDG